MKVNQFTRSNGYDSTLRIKKDPGKGIWKRIQEIVGKKSTWVLSRESSRKQALKRVIAALWMEKEGLPLEHKDSKRGNPCSLRADDETKSPPCKIWSFVQRGEVAKAMVVQFDWLTSLCLTDNCWFGLVSACRSFMAPHESWSKSALTTKFAKSSPLINLQTRTKPRRHKIA
jgi:hypothetical protein